MILDLICIKRIGHFIPFVIYSLDIGLSKLVSPTFLFMDFRGSTPLQSESVFFRIPQVPRRLRGGSSDVIIAPTLLQLERRASYWRAPGAGTPTCSIR